MSEELGHDIGEPEQISRCIEALFLRALRQYSCGTVHAGVGQMGNWKYDS